MMALTPNPSPAAAGRGESRTPSGVGYTELLIVQGAYATCSGRSLEGGN